MLEIHDSMFVQVMYNWFRNQGTTTLPPWSQLTDNQRRDLLDKVVVLMNDAKLEDLLKEVCSDVKDTEMV